MSISLREFGHQKAIFHKEEKPGDFLMPQTRSMCSDPGACEQFRKQAAAAEQLELALAHQHGCEPGWGLVSMSMQLWVPYPSICNDLTTEPARCHTWPEENAALVSALDVALENYT